MVERASGLRRRRESRAGRRRRVAHPRPCRHRAGADAQNRGLTRSERAANFRFYEASSMTPSDAGLLRGALVSVVIPFYTRADLIGRALTSVVEQSYQHIEIIVVDDASTDNLTGALAPFAGAPLDRITHPRNRGAAAARNTGVAAA